MDTLWPTLFGLVRLISRCHLPFALFSRSGHAASSIFFSPHTPFRLQPNCDRVSSSFYDILHSLRAWGAFKYGWIKIYIFSAEITHQVSTFCVRTLLLLTRAAADDDVAWLAALSRTRPVFGFFHLCVDFCTNGSQEELSSL